MKLLPLLLVACFGCHYVQPRDVLSAAKSVVATRAANIPEADANAIATEMADAAQLYVLNRDKQALFLRLLDTTQTVVELAFDLERIPENPQ